MQQSEKGGSCNSTKPLSDWQARDGPQQKVRGSVGKNLVQVSIAPTTGLYLRAASANLSRSRCEATPYGTERAKMGRRAFL